jgi:hypothetical protein
MSAVADPALLERSQILLALTQSEVGIFHANQAASAKQDIFGGQRKCKLVASRDFHAVGIFQPAGRPTGQ